MNYRYDDSPSRIVFLTGSGLSADSGIPTFRGEAGLYNGIRAEELLSYNTMRRSPEIIQTFVDNMRIKMKGTLPNKAHHMIAKLGNDFGDRVIHLTQNIDPLVEMAGYNDSVHLHGFITRMRSIGNSKVLEDIGFTRYWDGEPSEAPEKGFKFKCPKTGSLMRPDVVMFGEQAPEYSKMHNAIKRLREQDVLVVIGTQGNVLPVQQIAYMVPAMTVLNNLHSSPDISENLFDHVFMEKAVDAADDIENMIRDHLK